LYAPFNNIIEHRSHARILYFTHFENAHDIKVSSDIYRLRKKFELSLFKSKVVSTERENFLMKHYFACIVHVESISFYCIAILF